jgi:hypothetical protein
VITCYHLIIGNIAIGVKVENKEWDVVTRVMVTMTKRFRYEIKKRAAIRNISMREYIEAACIEAMKLEDSYNE